MFKEYVCGGELLLPLLVKEYGKGNKSHINTKFKYTIQYNILIKTRSYSQKKNISTENRHLIANFDGLLQLA